jgi:hypothetical protein
MQLKDFYAFPLRLSLLFHVMSFRRSICFSLHPDELQAHTFLSHYKKVATVNLNER